MTQRLIVLFAHGARDARWSETLRSLQAEVTAREPSSEVRVAFLEFQQPTLPAVLNDAAARGVRSIAIVPVFWASGGHVANDLPPLLADFRHRHPTIDVRLLPVLSELPGLLAFVADAVVSARD
jgi:sirohydrochlorin cobaltochelatase